MKKQLITTGIYFGILIVLSVYASAGVNYYDLWTYSHSTNYDMTTWGGYNLSTYASGFSQNADCICWDWCDGGESDNTVYIWENCYCSDWTKELSCESYSNIVSNVCGSGSCSSYLLEANHPIGTGSSGNRWTCSVDMREFRDCDNNAGQQATIDYSSWPYFVIYPKKSLCYNNNVDTLGKYSDTDWWFYDSDRDCDSAYTRCDADSSHNHHDNQEVYTASGQIPDPCSTKDGSTSYYKCSEDEDCYSENCGGGASTYTGYCDSDGSDSFYVNLNLYNNTCGGAGYYAGYYIGWTDTNCSIAMSNIDYICDYDLANNGGSKSTYNPSNYCKKKEYSSCSVSADCWNDNGGYDCMGTTGNKICTTGENGKSCYNEDDSQCDSVRCDSTCQAKLANGNSCNENSDCTSSTCCGGTCSSLCLPDIDIYPSLLIFNIG
jgi:hypothetical protein